jgi:hypothetical protein
MRYSSVCDIDVTDDKNLYVSFALSASDLKHRNSFADGQYPFTHVVYDDLGVEREFGSEFDANEWIDRKHPRVKL